MSDMTFVDASSWVGSVVRAWKGESRKTFINEVEKIISQTLEAINTHKNTEYLLSLIINSLSVTKIGVESLKITYRGDPEMLARIDVQITNMDLPLNKYRGLIKGYRHDGVEKDFTTMFPSDKLEDDIDKVINTSDSNLDATVKRRSRRRSDF